MDVRLTYVTINRSNNTLWEHDSSNQTCGSRGVPTASSSSMTRAHYPNLRTGLRIRTGICTSTQELWIDVQLLGCRDRLVSYTRYQVPGTPVRRSDVMKAPPMYHTGLCVEGAIYLLLLWDPRVSRYVSLDMYLCRGAWTSTPHAPNERRDVRAQFIVSGGFAVRPRREPAATQLSRDDSSAPQKNGN